MKVERRLLFFVLFLEEFVTFVVSWFNKQRFFTGKMPFRNKITEINHTCLVDLPELVLDCILQRLSPAELCIMAGVCRSLREKCVSDQLWVKHLKTKWGKLIGHVSFNQWQCRISSLKRPIVEDQTADQKSLLTSFSTIRPFSWIKPKFETKSLPRTSLRVDSIMALYLSRERGMFWFPAQVYNRENGHVGFLLSCYDAQISYDSQKDTFQARYSPYGRRMIEDGIKWNRISAPPVDTPAHDLHISDCLNDLKPGDHIEIQWRRSKEFPFGWLYAVVGHMESCDGNEHECPCHHSDIVVLEFKQYPHGSRWRQTKIKRKEHREEANGEDGFYGGIRRLHKEEEVSAWKQL